MEGCDGGEMRFQQERNVVTNCESNPISHEASAMAMTPMMMMSKSSNVHQDPFFSSGWVPHSTMAHGHQNFGCPPIVSHRDFANFHLPPVPLWENQGITPHLPNYPPPNSGFLEMVPTAPSLMSSGLTDMVGPVGLSQYGPVTNSRSGYALNVEGGGSEEAQDRGEDTMNCPAERRRKRTLDSSSPYESNKSNERDAHRDSSGDTRDIQRKHHEKKQKTEQLDSTNSRGKQTKEDSNSGELHKENYIHVRARRGQATNSHSLAERVRREKISERMRMLQELVPGCNKITGKAVMLDEIINYVQSLQQQVEFLSMKLATVLPDLSTDMERVLSKELLQAGGRESIAHGLGPGTGPPLPYNNIPGIFQGALLGTTSQYPSLSQAQLATELQTHFPMGFDSTSAIDILKQNGRLKPEQ
ncbi:hypothetical protein SAY86_021137 [Trapa natans]|uniref:BHLH domain-containing protein n=1 Tax=Trapa natans TaxID=22666 RepID=A0AAN7MRW8_TRANT|nr:hypothetical protein SAY86_021137 [Trapa natans]